MINSPTQEETIKLINEAQQGDNNAKEVLLKYNYPLIKSVIKRFLNKGDRNKGNYVYEKNSFAFRWMETSGYICMGAWHNEKN